ncbi:MAG: bifunctional 3-(3-hydroxy-phenyl)propionate/3-hydroxycinnamic acid hydroxylase [Candidatus Nanopelagicales bacterium]
MQAPEETEVVIVGAGPVGLMLANLLGVYGRRAVVLETLDSLIDYPRAVGLDDEAFRLIQTVGLAERIEPLTGPMHIMRLVDARGRVILHNDPQRADFGWPRKNAFNQPLVDAELARGLDRFDGVDLRFGHTVEDVEEDVDGVTVHAQVRHPDGGVEVRTLRAQYLVGCEGGRSPTRKRIGVDFDGLSPSTRWLVVDVANDPLGTPNVWLGADPRRAYVSIGLPQGVRRFEFRLRDDEPDDVVTQPEWVAEMLREHVPDPSTLEFIRWRVYTHHGRVASSFRKGRQLIAGDAAHLMPVWLGQGWNSGVRDAMNLGWKLATVLAGQADDALLDTYTAERKPHVTQMVSLSMRMGDVIKMTNPVAVAARDAAARVVNRIPAWRDYFGELRFRPQPRYTEGVLADQSTLAPGRSEPRLTATSIPFLQTADKTSAVGVQFPQPRVATAAGDGQRLDDVLGPWWSLVLWINDAGKLLDGPTLAELGRLGARLVTVVPEAQRPWAEANASPGVLVVGDTTGRLKQWFDTRPVGAVLLRPDRFVAGASLAQQTPQMVRSVLTALRFTGAGGPPRLSLVPAPERPPADVAADLMLEEIR